LVRGLLVLGLVLDDETLLQDDVEAGLDILVVGLLLLFVFLTLAGSFDDGGRGRGQDLVDVVLVLLVEVRDLVVFLFVLNRGFLVEVQILVVEVEFLLVKVLRVLDVGALCLQLFDFCLLLGRHVCRGSIDGRNDGSIALLRHARAHSSAVSEGSQEGLGGRALGSLAPSCRPGYPDSQHVLYSTPRANFRLSQLIPPYCNTPAVSMGRGDCAVP